MSSVAYCKVVFVQRFVQLPISDSTEITAGCIKVRLEGHVPLDAPQRKIHFYLTRVALVVSEILWGPKITLGGPAPPGRPQQKKYIQIEYFTYPIAFLILTFQLQQFPRYQGVQNYMRGPAPPARHQQKFSCIPRSCISQYLIAFLIVTFQLQYFPRYQGVPKFYQGHCTPWMLRSRKIFIPKASRPTLAYLIAFLISTFQLQQFFEMLQL